MIAVRLSRDQWLVALAAAEGLHAQLRELVGPFADGASSRQVSAVRIMGDLQSIERAIRRAMEEG